ncbi:MAG: ATP phosphoribosyltransferase [Stenotrophobium sp.]
MTTLTIALSKGRILEDSLPLLEKIGLRPAGDIGRLLRVPTNHADVSLLIIRPADVPTFVEYGAADMGVTGKDVLMEHGGEALYEPLDLGIARCRLSIAQKKNAPPRDENHRLRVATKYPELTRRHYAARNQQVEIIKLYGSMELAPLVGLADVIVDLVDTGNTLKANGLIETEVITPISARMVVNKASMKVKHAVVREWLDKLREVCADA